MRKALILFILFLRMSNVYSHSVSDSAKGRFGTYQAFSLSDTRFPWNEITFFPGDYFTMRNLTPECEDTFGHGTYSHSGDTLVLRDISTWSTLKCTTELLENIIIPEKRYLYRIRSTNQFEIALMQTEKSIKPKWVLFRKVPDSKLKPTRDHKK